MTDELIDWLQWPAMAVSVAAAWFLGSPSPLKRGIGFWGMLVSNAMWAVWGWHDGAFALIALQFCLAAMNIRGLFKAESEAEAKPSSDSS
ncbi:MAG: hypothetical protein H7Z39_02325 [Burkholderiaceae bacterium]|nr:hypothetical protein [Burkholderiaceae bacterium]